MVGILTINGEVIEGLVKRPGDGTGSYLDAVMYLGLMELPPATLSTDDVGWLEKGGKICWVYEFSSNITYGLNTTTTPPNNPVGWVKLVSVCGDVRYIQDTFNHPDYLKLVEDLRPKPQPQKKVVEEVEIEFLPTTEASLQKGEFLEVRNQCCEAEKDLTETKELENLEKEESSSDSDDSDLAIKLRQALGGK